MVNSSKYNSYEKLLGFKKIKRKGEKRRDMIIEYYHNNLIIEKSLCIFPS